MEYGGRKRERPEGAFTGNGAFKKSKDVIQAQVEQRADRVPLVTVGDLSATYLLTEVYNFYGVPMDPFPFFEQRFARSTLPLLVFAVTTFLETESFTTGVGSKSKPCMKFFSTSGCQFGEGCHFLHYVPGYSALSQLSNLVGNPAIPAGRNAPFGDGPTPTVKTKLCNKFNTPEGCRFGDKCHFAHGEMELGKSVAPGYEDPRGMGQMSRFSGQVEHNNPGLGVAASFGTSATAKISIDASLAGAVIGKNGVNSKQICRLTGVKLSIKDHDSDPNQRNIELEGTFDQIKEATTMVRELIGNLGGVSGRPTNPTGSFARAAPARQFKSKMCENFPKGSCTFGERCHFAHSASELRKPPA